MRITYLILGAALACALTQSARADWRAFKAHAKLQQSRYNAWPAPFQQQDRESVRNVFHMMADNGWRQQTTMDDYQFTSDQTDLSPAGKYKLWWIATQAPLSHRCVFVLSGKTPQETDLRMSVVKRHLTAISPQASTIDVQTTGVIPPTMNGGYIQRLYDGAYENLPVPQLPNQGSGGTQVGIGTSSLGQ